MEIGLQSNKLELLKRRGGDEEESMNSPEETIKLALEFTKASIERE